MLRIRTIAIQGIGLAVLAAMLAGPPLLFGSPRLSNAATAPVALDSGATASPLLTPTPEARRRPPEPVPGTLYNATFSEQVGRAPLGWATFGPPVRVETTAAGRLGARVTVGSVGISWLGQAVPIRGGSAFEMRARAGGDGRAVIRVSWHATADGSGASLGFVESEPVESPGGSTLLVAGPFGTPGDARSIRVRLVVEGPTGTSALFYDLSLIAATVPAPTSAAAVDTTTPAGQAAIPAVATPVPVAGAGAPAATPSATAAARIDSAGPVAGRPGTPEGTTSDGAVRPPPSPTQRPRIQAPLPALKINEIGFAMSGEVWVELYNASDTAAPLEGWTLVDGAGADALPALTLPGHAYVIIATGAGFMEDFPWFAAAIVFFEDRPGGASRVGGSLELLGPEEVAADAVSWGSDAAVFATPPVAVSLGRSIERSPAGLDRDLPQDFVENAHPTPGYGLRAGRVVDGGRGDIEVALWAAAFTALLTLLVAAGAALVRRLGRRRGVPVAAGGPVGAPERVVIDALGPPSAGGRRWSAVARGESPRPAVHRGRGAPRSAGASRRWPADRAAWAPYASRPSSRSAAVGVPRVGVAGFADPPEVRSFR